MNNAASLTPSESTPEFSSLEAHLSNQGLDKKWEQPNIKWKQPQAKEQGHPFLLLHSIE